MWKGIIIPPIMAICTGPMFVLSVFIPILPGNYPSNNRPFRSCQGDFFVMKVPFACSAGGARRLPSGNFFPPVADGKADLWNSALHGLFGLGIDF